MEMIIRRAIRTHKLIEFYHDGAFRIVEPYCLGISSRGNLLLRAYQVAGGSTSGHIPPWRLFDVGKMSRTLILGESYSPARPEYNPVDPAMQTILATA